MSSDGDRGHKCWQVWNCEGTASYCHAELQDRIIVSKNEDFFYFAKQRHAKIKVIWVCLGNCRTSALLAAFGRSWPRIDPCLNAGDRVIEIR